MLHEFLDANRDELIERCRAKVARRLALRPTRTEMENGIPLFLGQLIEMLRSEQVPEGWDDPKVSRIRGNHRQERAQGDRQSCRETRA